MFHWKSMSVSCICLNSATLQWSDPDLSLPLLCSETSAACCSNKWLIFSCLAHWPHTSDINSIHNPPSDDSLTLSLCLFVSVQSKILYSFGYPSFSSPIPLSLAICFSFFLSSSYCRTNSSVWLVNLILQHNTPSTAGVYIFRKCCKSHLQWFRFGLINAV